MTNRTKHTPVTRWSPLGVIIVLTCALGACEPPEEEAPAEECQFGEEGSQLCECGVTITRLCGDSGWNDWDNSCGEVCETANNPEVNNPNNNNNGRVCDPADVLTEPCGECGERTRTCSDAGQWTSWSACDEPPRCQEAQCERGDTRLEPCGECGEREQACEDGQWGAWGACQPGECTEDCSPRDVMTRDCGECMTQTRVCTPDGHWSEWDTCAADAECVEPECGAGETESRTCNGCGTAVRWCNDGLWTGWGACDETACPACEDGSIQTRSCGTCGTQSSECQGGAWQDFDSCDEPAECPNTCASMSAVWASDNMAMVVGLAEISSTRLAMTTRDEWGDGGNLQYVDLTDGTATVVDSFGDMWNSVMVQAVSAPVVVGEDVLLTYATWRAEFGDDGPELYLNRYDSQADTGWGAHVWSYDQDSWITGDDVKPVLAGNMALINTATPYSTAMVTEQLRGYTLADGELSWSLDNPLAGAVVSAPDGSAVYSQGSGLVLRHEIGAEASQLLYYESTDGYGSIRSSHGPVLSKDGSVLYVPNSVFSIDVDPQRDRISAVSTTPPPVSDDIHDYEASIWTHFFEMDQRIAASPVLTAEFVIVPLNDGLIALDREDGTVVWRLHTEGQAHAPLVGDAGEIFYQERVEGTEPGHNDFYLGVVGVDGRPAARCEFATDVPADSATGRPLNPTPPILRDGHLYVSGVTRIVSFDVGSQNLADTGWPRDFGDNANSSRPHP